MPHFKFFILTRLPRALINQLCKEAELHGALEIIKQRNIPLSRDDGYYFLQQCCCRKDLQSGRRLQLLAHQFNLHTVGVLADHLIRLFSMWGCWLEAQEAFNNVLQSTAYTWSSILSACANHGQENAALNLYARLQLCSVKCDRHVYLAILKACSLTLSLPKGREIHDQIIQNGLQTDVFLESLLIDMYAKCGSLEESCEAFDRMLNGNVVSWTAMIGGYVQHDKGLLALQCFEKMQTEKIRPNEVTFLGVFKACGIVGEVERSRLIHEQMITSSVKVDLVVGSALVDTYAKCCGLAESQNVFNNLPEKNIVSWSALIAGYAQYEEGQKALECFSIMQWEGIKPDRFIYSSILKACGSMAAIEQGRLLHENICYAGIEWDDIVGNALVDMYAKCYSLDESQKVFKKLKTQNVVSWNSMIAGYAEYGEGLLAIDSFEKMQEQGIKPNKVTFFSVSKACGNMGALEQARLIHDMVLEHGLLQDVTIVNSLIDMYSGCGSLEESCMVFDTLPNRNTVSWNVLVAGYAQHGKTLLALQCLERMEEESAKPDKVTFLCILVACSRAGLVDKGRCYFELMRKAYRITPDMGHYLCMIDLLGRGGCLKEAEDLLQATGQPLITGLKCLLNACRLNGNVELGKCCFDKMVLLDPSCAPAYVLISNIYADTNMQKATDSSNPKFEMMLGHSDDINLMLERLNEQIEVMSG